MYIIYNKIYIAAYIYIYLFMYVYIQLYARKLRYSCCSCCSIKQMFYQTYLNTFINLDIINIHYDIIFPFDKKKEEEK